jgi:hypothetical protein
MLRGIFAPIPTPFVDEAKAEIRAALEELGLV